MTGPTDNDPREFIEAVKVPDWVRRAIRRRAHAAGKSERAIVKGILVEALAAERE